MSQENFQPPGVGETSQSVSIFEGFYKVKWSKLPMLRGVPGALPDVLRWIPLQDTSDDVQILMLWSRISFFPLQVLPGAS